MKNVGKTDRIIRLVLGTVLVGVGAFWQCLICAIVGLLLLITGILQTCPAYKLMRIKTCKSNE
jgi:hypothetical protein